MRITETRFTQSGIPLESRAKLEQNETEYIWAPSQEGFCKCQNHFNFYIE